MATLNVKNFFTGLITNVDSKDVPLDAGTNGTQNLDPNANGKLQGAPIISSLGSLAIGASAISADWIERSDGKRDIVVATAADTQIYTDVYGTAGITTDASSNSSSCVVTNNEEAHVGCGVSNNARWTGYVRHPQFGGAAPGLTHANSACANVFEPSKTTVQNGEVNIYSCSISGTAGYFDSKSYYYFALTMIYDGVQESPMYQLDSFTVNYGNLLQGSVGNSCQVNIVAKGFASLNSRISGINLYISNTKTTYVDLANKTLWRLVDTIDINAAGWTTGDGTYGTTVNDKYISYTFNGQNTVTYQENSGIAETLDYTDVKWSLACKTNNYHFVSKCSHTNLTSDDGAHLMFRSKPFRFDTFDWSNDFIALPFIPKAQIAFNNRIYVFDNYQLARIEPEGFYIEDVYVGAGCSTQQGVIATEFGLFFANAQHCYWFDGSSVKTISIPIENNWKTSATGTTIVMGYSGKTNQVLFFAGDTCYGYYLPTERWDYYSDAFGAETFYGVTTGKNGEAICFTGGDIYDYFGSTTKRSWVYITPEYDFNDPSQKKQFNEVEVDESTATVTTTYGVDGATPTTAIASLNNPYNKTLQVKLSGNATAVADSLAIRFRKMIGDR